MGGKKMLKSILVHDCVNNTYSCTSSWMVDCKQQSFTRPPSRQWSDFLFQKSLIKLNQKSVTGLNKNNY